jgi:hypothetical protein
VEAVAAFLKRSAIARISAKPGYSTENRFFQWPDPNLIKIMGF